jgi:catechol 2,3-dioxygenase-like lactoylglutathione lyase family enzyme
VNHLALAVRDRGRSQRFYETYLGFDAEPPREYDGGVLMLYDAAGFALALAPVDELVRLPPFLHFGKGLSSPDEVRAARDRFRTDGVEIVEEWEERGYVSVKARDPDGYVVELAWEPEPGSTDPGETVVPD